MDDILVHTSTKEEHWELVRQVLKILRQNKLFLKPKKCEFKWEQVNYLGAVISGNRVAVDPKKVEAIVSWPKPKKLVKVQEFIRFLNFYQRFIEGFSQIARPLHNLTKKDTKFLWTNECQMAFNELKEWIMTIPVLAMAQDKGLIRIKADACQYTIGGVLSQEQERGFRPIAYFSKSLNDAKQNYNTYNRELLAIMKVLREWQHYMIGWKFIRQKHENRVITRNNLVVMPKRWDLQWRIILAHHDLIMAGHLCQHKTQELISRDYYWEGLTHDVWTYINRCSTCPKATNRGTSTNRDPQTTMEDHYHGLHWTVTWELRKQHDPQHHQQALKDPLLTSMPGLNPSWGGSLTIPGGNMASWGDPRVNHHWLRTSIHGHIY